MCRSIRHLGRSLVWSVALTALVGACAPAQPPTPAAPRASDQSPAAPASQSAAPAAQSAGASGASSTGPAEWVVAIAEEPASIDPPVGTTAAASMMAQLHLFDALVAFEGPTMKPVGKLAESWRVIDDNTWELKLRQGVGSSAGNGYHSAAAAKLCPPSTCPRSTVTEALGSVNVACGPPGTVVPTGGPSGSAWLSAPSFFHTYCSLPKLTCLTGPAKDAARLPAESSKRTRTVCACVWSRFTSITDQFRSGRCTA